MPDTMIIKLITTEVMGWKIHSPEISEFNPLNNAKDCMVAKEAFIAKFKPHDFNSHFLKSLGEDSGFVTIEPQGVVSGWHGGYTWAKECRAICDVMAVAVAKDLVERKTNESAR